MLAAAAIVAILEWRFPHRTEWRPAAAEVGTGLQFIEEPIGTDRHVDLPDIARALDCRLVLDESFVRLEQLSLLGDPLSQWIVNVRISKMGGLIARSPLIFGGWIILLLRGPIPALALLVLFKTGLDFTAHRTEHAQT